MADFTYNVALGRVAELVTRVNNNDPTNAVFLLIAYVTTEGDATLKDLDTVADIESNVNTAEATNTNYSRQTIDDTGSLTETVDDTNDRVEVDCPDQTFSSISAGDNWTDLVFAYDSDSTGGTDANVEPLSQHDFAVTPDGSDITAQMGADGFWQAS
jgi:hypothetical protein